MLASSPGSRLRGSGPFLWLRSPILAPIGRGLAKKPGVKLSPGTRFAHARRGNSLEVLQILGSSPRCRGNGDVCKEGGVVTPKATSCSPRHR